MIKSKIINIIGAKRILEAKYCISFINYNKLKKYKNTKKILYLLTPTHGNMGDQAIAFATNKFLSEKFSEYTVVEFERDDIYRYGKSIKRILNKNDLIVLHGGGNMGNLYINEELPRRLIIDKFNKNKIISMTQTISFTNDKDGKRELNKTRNIYNKHNNLTVIAREEKSYKIMQKEFKNANIVINPDIVLYLYDIYKLNKEHRNNIMTCLRNDKESIQGEYKDLFINELNRSYKNVVNYDTVINKVVTIENREKELEVMFNEFRKSKVVITDRLHGMIFCAITKTPCIVMKSLDHKVTGTYQWLKELNYIKFVDRLDFDSIKPLIDELSNLKKFNEIDFNKLYFNKLREKILI